jgi:hypothetical protein
MSQHKVEVIGALPQDMTQDMIEKIAVGDGLTDAELAVALEFYTDLQQKLRLLGPTFHLAWVEVNRIQRDLERFKFHRENG